MGKRVGERIRQIRDLKGLSQENVAEEIGMSHGNFGKIERGVIDVSDATLMAIAKALKVNVSDFFEFEPRDTMKEIKGLYGYATRDELSMHINSLYHAINALRADMEQLRSMLPEQKANAKKPAKNRKHGDR